MRGGKCTNFLFACRVGKRKVEVGQTFDRMVSEKKSVQDFSSSDLDLQREKWYIFPPHLNIYALKFKGHVSSVTLLCFQTEERLPLYSESHPEQNPYHPHQRGLSDIEMACRMSTLSDFKLVSVCGDSESSSASFQTG